EAIQARACGFEERRSEIGAAFKVGGFMDDAVGNAIVAGDRHISKNAHGAWIDAVDNDHFVILPRYIRSGFDDGTRVSEFLQTAAQQRGGFRHLVVREYLSATQG